MVTPMLAEHATPIAQPKARALHAAMAKPAQSLKHATTDTPMRVEPATPTAQPKAAAPHAATEKFAQNSKHANQAKMMWSPRKVAAAAMTTALDQALESAVTVLSARAKRHVTTDTQTPAVLVMLIAPAPAMYLSAAMGISALNWKHAMMDMPMPVVHVIPTALEQV